MITFITLVLLVAEGSAMAVATSSSALR